MGNFAFSRPRSVGQCRAQITTLLGGFSLVAVVMALSWLFVVSAGPSQQEGPALFRYSRAVGETAEQVKFYLSLVR